jgi:hypothetical protein
LLAAVDTLAPDDVADLTVFATVEHASPICEA